MLPFTVAEFYASFARYNAVIEGPTPVLAYMLGVTALVAAWRSRDRIVDGVLALFWLWSGVVYHWLFFTDVTAMAWLFGALFVIEAALLVWFGTIRRATMFGAPRGWTGVIGVAFVVYAMVLYPALGLAAGHAYAAIPQFGVAPCPMTIFTFGLFLLAWNVPWPLLIVPVLWSLIGGSAAVLLNVPQDWPLLVSGPLTAALLWLKRRRALA